MHKLEFRMSQAEEKLEKLLKSMRRGTHWPIGYFSKYSKPKVVPESAPIMKTAKPDT